MFERLITHQKEQVSLNRFIKKQSIVIHATETILFIELINIGLMS